MKRIRRDDTRFYSGSRTTRNETYLNQQKENSKIHLTYMKKIKLHTVLRKPCTTMKKGQRNKKYATSKRITQRNSKQKQSPNLKSESTKLFI
jgi:hypothetical protein